MNLKRKIQYIKELLVNQNKSKQIKNGVVTWNTANGFGWGDGESPPQVSAINYRMVQALFKDVGDNEYEHAVELGCGYGRLTPWLLEFSEEVSGIEPNENVLSLVDEYYPEINTICSKGQNLPLNDNCVDFILTRSVLQHIPDDQIDTVISEIESVTDENADILICEATEGDQSDYFYPRTVSEYDELFKNCEIKSSWRREAKEKKREHNRDRMFFKKL